MAALTAYLLIPASGVVALMTIGLLAEPDVPPHLWPIAIPALIPPLIIYLLRRAPAFGGEALKPAGARFVERGCRGSSVAIGR